MTNESLITSLLIAPNFSINICWINNKIKEKKKRKEILIRINLQKVTYFNFEFLNKLISSTAQLMPWPGSIPYTKQTKNEKTIV